MQIKKKTRVKVFKKMKVKQSDLEHIDQQIFIEARLIEYFI